MPKLRRKTATNPLLEKCSFDQVLKLDDDTPVRIQFNQEVYDRVWEHLPLLLFSRGIKTDIGAQDPDAALLMRKRSKRQDRRNINAGDVNAVNSRMRDVHGRAIKVAQAQLLLCYILDADDKLFSIEEITGGGVAVTLLPPFDQYEIPDAYWEDTAKDDPLKKLLVKGGHYISQEPVLDQSNPLEVMIALTAGILEENPKFNNAIIPFVEAATIGLSYGEVRLKGEDLSTFLQAVDDLLYPVVEDGDGSQ